MSTKNTETGFTEDKLKALEMCGFKYTRKRVISGKTWITFTFYNDKTSCFSHDTGSLSVAVEEGSTCADVIAQLRRHAFQEGRDRGLLDKANEMRVILGMEPTSAL